METTKVHSRRYANRTLVVGRTPFKFDSNGLCEVTRRPGYTSIGPDLRTLLKMNGVSEVKETEAEEAPTTSTTPDLPPPPPTRVSSSESASKLDVAGDTPPEPTTQVDGDSKSAPQDFDEVETQPIKTGTSSSEKSSKDSDNDETGKVYPRRRKARKR